MTQGDHGGDGPVPLSRGARTAARLRQAAREAFAELGWQGTRVEDIVQRAGVSHGSFYTYYDNKSAVLSDLVGALQADVVALGAAPWEADDVRGALERIIGGFLDIYWRDAVVIRTWLEAARDEPSFRELYLQSRRLFVRRVAEHLAAAAAASGRNAGPPADTVASALVAMVEHFAYCWAVLGERHERADAVGALVLVWGSALNALAGFEVVRLDQRRRRDAAAGS
ncbi:MAG TPA: TetR/AcrR family transcriptional regulator [Egibacteraceae bacterium]|nr:TetR/AcrR family transcriptional regulator [Actinomycetota bacterium]HWB71987.1 TetR/AcrR family transcriptional regulator [Egibacteraceae bacterium]